MLMVCLLSKINQLIEKTIHKQIFNFINQNNILYKHQYGYQPKKSTATALINITEHIKKNMENKLHTIGIYLDLSKAFDTVDHNILFDKLKYIGIRGHPLKLIKSYLQNRRQFTVIQEKTSDTHCISHGVPQGSVLGPLLFLIYTNDIKNSTTEELRLFADDTNIFISHHDPKVLKAKAEHTLSNIKDWFDANKLKVNTTKTDYSIFTTSTTLEQELNTLNFNNSKIHRSKSCKFLGLTLDDKLNFNEHTENLLNTLTKTGTAFKLIKNHVCHKDKHKLYNAYFNSKIKYGLETYGLTSNKNLKILQRQQNRTLKIFFNKDRRTRTKELHKELNILMIRDQRNKCLAEIVHKHLHKDTENTAYEDSSSVPFKRNNTIHNHNTRQTNDLHVPKFKTKIGQNTIEHTASKIWNELPIELQQIHKLHIFKKQLKKHHISKY